MKTSNNFKIVTVLLTVTCILIIIAGCATKKNTWGNQKTGYILEYQMAEGSDLKYGLNSDYTQSMEVMGQNIELVSNSTNEFTIDPMGLKKGNYNLKVTIDSISMVIKSARGEINPDMSTVIGKSFDFVVSPKGKELDYSGAESIKYILGETNETSIASDFQTVFPDLPERPVKPGESWNTIDTISEKSDGGELQIIGIVVNTFTGIEKINGYECVKVNSKSAGTLSGSGNMQGLQTTTTGTIESTDTWYFAYKEGVFIKMISSGIANSVTTTSGERELTIPSERNYTIVTERIR